MCEEKLLDAYLETGTVEEEEIRRLIQKRKLFPCFFGSALKLQGVKELLDGFCRLSELPCYSEDFGARIYKISYISQETGFCDCSHFIRVFQEFHGITPKKFRKNLHTT